MQTTNRIFKTRYPDVGYERVTGSGKDGWYRLDLVGAHPVCASGPYASSKELLSDLHAQMRASGRGPAGPRYTVIEESQSGHCCFSATVVDTHRPDDYEGFRGEIVERYEAVCECFDVVAARLVADALNRAHAA